MFLFKRRNTLANLDKLVELTSNNRYSVSFGESEKQLKQLKELSSLKFRPGKSIDSSYVETLTNIVNSQKRYDAHQAKFKEVDSKYTSIKSKVLEGKLDKAMLKQNAPFKQRNSILDQDKRLRKEYPKNKIVDPKKMLEELEQERHNNYIDNDGEYYKNQAVRIQYIKNNFSKIHEFKILDDLYNLGERPNGKIHDRIIELKNRNRELTAQKEEGGGILGWFLYALNLSNMEELRKKMLDDQIKKNEYIISQYYKLKNIDIKGVENNPKSLWQTLGKAAKNYIKEKKEHDKIKNLPELDFTIEKINKEEKIINASKFYKNERYDDNKEELAKIFEDILANSDVISSIYQEINELDPNYKKLPEDKARRFFEEAGNLAVGATKKAFDKIKGEVAGLFTKRGNFPEKILMDVESAYADINEKLADRNLDTILCLSWLRDNEIDVDSLTKNPLENVENINKVFRSVFKYASINEFCKEWKGIYRSNYEYLKTTKKMLGKPINDFINAYYNNESDKSKPIGFKDELLGHSIRLSKKLNSINNNIEKCNEKAAVGAKTADEALSKRYKNMNDFIVGVCKNIGGDSEKEIIRKHKNYQDDEKRKKLWLFQIEKTLKVYSENLRVHNDLIYIGANVKDDLTYLNKTSLVGAQESCKELIRNIHYHKEILGSFHKLLRDRKDLINQDMVDAAFYPKQDDAMSKQFFIGQLPELNSESLANYNECFEINIPNFINKNVRNNFLKNCKYFKRNPYMAKMWSSAIKERMNDFSQEVTQTYERFKGDVDPENLNSIKISYEKLTRNFTDLDKFFDGVKTGELVYEDIDIFSFFSREFWRKSSRFFNDLRIVFKFCGFTGPYLEIFKNITPLKVVKHARPFLLFYVRWITEISPNFLDFDSAKNKVMDEITESKYSDDKTWKMIKYYRIIKDNIKLLMIPEFFDTNSGIDSKLGVVLDILAGVTRVIFKKDDFLDVVRAVLRIVKESNNISKLLYPKKYATRDEYYKREKLNNTYKVNLSKIANQNKKGLGRIDEHDEQEMPKFLEKDLLKETYLKEFL